MIRRAVVLMMAVAFVATAVGWARGHWSSTILVATGFGGRGILLAVGGGTVYAAGCTTRTTPAWSVFTATQSRQWLTEYHEQSIEAADRAAGDVPAKQSKSGQTEPNRFCFGGGYGTDALGIAGTHFGYATAPAWLIELVLGTTVWRAVNRWRTMRLRRRGGLCLSCGYDLRHSTVRCPECGVAVLTESTPGLE